MYGATVTATTTTTAEPSNVACSTDDAQVARKYRTVPPQELEAQVVSRVHPRLGPDRSTFGRYLVSVDVDGHVTEVRIFEAAQGNLAVASALCQWKFKPQPEPTRSVLVMQFSSSTPFR